MLKSWSIENFKSIVNSGEIQLAPVTVLAGLNSSGKSSFLQSILMIAQTLSSRLLERPLLPNGTVIQPGTFDDILHENATATTPEWLKLSFELIFDGGEADPSIRRGIVRSRPARTHIKSIRISAKFRGFHEKGASNSAIESSRVIVEEVSIRVVSDSSEILSAADLQGAIFSETQLENSVFDFDIRNISPSELRRFLKDVDPSYLRLVPASEDNINYLGRFKVNKDIVNRDMPYVEYLVSLAHFLPVRLLQRFKIKIRQRRRLTNTLRYFFASPGISSNMLHSLSEMFDPEMEISDNLRASIYKFCEEENLSEGFLGETIKDLRGWFREKSPEHIRKEKFVFKLVQLIAHDLMEEHFDLDISSDDRAEGLEVEINNAYVENMEEAVENGTRFFTSKIRYLGPLRADPQAVQGFAPSSELDEVGAKGEYAAAVYDANQNAHIEWYNPISKQIEQGTLKAALDNWAEYLEIAHQIKIEEAGRSGVSWQVVHREGFKPRPLASVGVGVSQILPILVMGLLAPKNTLLLIEQPELHLHPRVQARLGDFFVGLAKCNKQCLIETHSENLVSQLRYHMVQAGGQEKSDCRIYFVDQDETGASHFDPVEISPNGNILNWPDGFFDETMLQEDRITAASLKKRAGNARKG